MVVLFLPKDEISIGSDSSKQVYRLTPCQLVERSAAVALYQGSSCGSWHCPCLVRLKWCCLGRRSSHRLPQSAIVIFDSCRLGFGYWASAAGGCLRRPSSSCCHLPFSSLETNHCHVCFWWSGCSDSSLLCRWHASSPSLYSLY